MLEMILLRMFVRLLPRHIVVLKTLEQNEIMIQLLSIVTHIV